MGHLDGRADRQPGRAADQLGPVLRPIRHANRLQKQRHSVAECLTATGHRGFCYLTAPAVVCGSWILWLVPLLPASTAIQHLARA
jgi:hypothetical protein